MLEKLKHIDIIHGDLHTDNVMWDQEIHTFFPIDITNLKESFFKKNPEDKTMSNWYTEEEWDAIVDEIKGKIYRSVTVTK